MIILGIDPGIAIVGWGVIRFENSKSTALDYGSVMTGPELSVEERLEIIYDRLDSIIKKYRPDAVSVEELFWNTNQKTGIIVAEARGTILLCARKNGIDIFEYTPLQVKQSVTGYGRAEKKQIISLVTMMLGLDAPPKPDDTADALALALCHAHCSSSRVGKYFNASANAGLGRRKYEDERYIGATNIVVRGKTVFFDPKKKKSEK